MAQLASASGLGPEGPVFESQYPDIQKKNSLIFSEFFFLLKCKTGLRITQLWLNVKFGGVDILGDETAAMN